MSVEGAEQTKSQIHGVSGEIQTFENQAIKATQTTDQVSKSTEKMGTSFKDSTLSISAAATSATGLFFQYDNLQKASLRVAVAEKNLTSASATLISAKAALNSLVEKGITSGDQYETAVLRQKSAQEQLEIATQRVDLSQGDLFQRQLQFVMQIVPTVITSYTALRSGLGGISTASIQTRVNTALLGPPMLSLTGTLGGTAIAAGATSTGLRGVGIAARLAQIAMGPVGWAMLGISTVMGLVATNTFGLRDALGPVADFLFPETTAAAEEMNTELEDSSNVVEEAGDKIKTYSEWLEDNEKKTADARRESEYYLQSISALADVTSLTSTEIEQLTSFLKDQADQAADTAQENFDLVASTYDYQTALELNDEQLDSVADKLRALEDIQKAAADAAEEEADAQRRATEELRGRTQANVEFLESLGITIDKSKTTTSETERIAEIYEDIQDKTRRAREELEEFAVTQGVDIVEAVQASDEELVSMITSLGGLGEETTKTRENLVKNFEEAKEAIAGLKTPIEEDQTVLEVLSITGDTAMTTLADSVSISTDSIIEDFEDQMDAIDDLITRYKKLESRKKSAGGGSSESNIITGSGISTNFGKLAVIPNARGGEGVVNKPTLFLAGEAGSEHYKFTPLEVGGSVSRGGNSTINLTVITTLDGQEVARSVSRHQARAL